MANVKKLKIKDTTYSLDAYNADSATKLKTARSIALGTGATGTATNFDGSSNITIPVTSVKESYLEWGGKNFSGSWGPIDAAMVPNFAANRFAFLPASAITSEYSTNGGSTWTATTSSSARENIFANGGGFIIGNSTATGVDKKNYKCRITITTSGVVYTTLNKFAIRISSNGSSGCHVKIESRTKANQDAGTNTWATNCERAELGGWPGWNIVNISPITTHGNTTAQYSQIRFTFGVDSHNSSVTYTGLSVIRIMAFGGEGWSTPSNMANDGHLYSYDSAQNATFPASVNATSLKENGTALSSKYSVKSHTHSVTAKGSISNTTAGGSVSSTFTGTAHNHTFTGSAVTSGKPDTTNVTTIYSITGVGSLPSASLSSGTLPSCSYTAPSHSYTAPSLSGSVSNQCLTLTWSPGSHSFSAGSHSFSAGEFPSLTFNAGSLPTRSSAISIPNANHTHSVTASGTVANTTATGSVSSTFTGTAHNHTFTGSAVTSATES